MTKSELLQAWLNHAIASIKQDMPLAADFEILYQERFQSNNYHHSDFYKKSFSDPRIPDKLLPKHIETAQFKAPSVVINYKHIDAFFLLNPKISESLLRENYSNNNYLYLIARNSSLLKEFIPRLIEIHPQEIAVNPILSPDHFKDLFKSEGFFLRYQLFRNPSLPMEYIEEEFKISKKDRYTHYLFNNIKTPTHMIDYLVKNYSKDYSSTMSLDLAIHPNLSEESVTKLLAESYFLVKMGLRPNLSFKTVKAMLKLKNVDNINNLAGNPNLDKESFFYLFDFLRNFDDAEKAYLNLSLNRGIPEELFGELTNKKISRQVQLNAKTHPYNPETRIRELLKLPFTFN